MRFRTVVLLASSSILFLNASPTAGQVVTGRVMDPDGNPLPFSTIAVMGQDSDTVDIVRADTVGRFALDRLRPGEFWLTAEQLGYQATQTFIHLSEGDSLEVEVRLDIDAIALEPLTVTASQRPWWENLAPPAHWEFYERREFYTRLGSGTFLTYPDLEPLQGMPVALAVADLTPFMSTVAAEGRSRSLILQSRPGCTPVIFLDGIQLRGTDIEEFISLSQISAIEVYRGASDVPGEFRTQGSNCGAVAIWSQRVPRRGR